MMKQEVRELTWYQIRQQALERDRYVCQGRKCEGGYKILDVHHKIPRSKGGLDVLENLITLCPSCHKENEPKYVQTDRILRDPEWKDKEISRVGRARFKSASIRVTLPERIAEGLKLKIRDLVEWELFTEKNGETYARIKKSK